MITDIEINFEDQALNDIGNNSVINDVVEANAIQQALLLRLMTPKGSFPFDTNFGSNLYSLKKTNENIQADLTIIINDAWRDEISDGTIVSFEILDVTFESGQLAFSISVSLPDKNIILNSPNG